MLGTIDKKHLIHIVSEIIVFIGIIFYFNQKHKKTLNIIEYLAQKVEEQDELLQKHEEVIKKIVAHINQQSPAPMTQQPPAPMTQQPPAPMTQQPPAPMVQQPPAPMVQQPPAPMVQQPPASMVQQPPAPMVQQPPPPMVQQPPPPMVQQPSELLLSTTTPIKNPKREQQSPPSPTQQPSFPLKSSSLDDSLNIENTNQINLQQDNGEVCSDNLDDEIKDELGELEEIDLENAKTEKNTITIINLKAENN